MITLFFGWQQAVAVLLDPAGSVDRCQSAWLREQRHAAELDLLTDGWFRRWLVRRGVSRPEVDCVGRVLDLTRLRTQADDIQIVAKLGVSTAHRFGIAPVPAIEFDLVARLRHRMLRA